LTIPARIAIIAKKIKMVKNMAKNKVEKQSLTVWVPKSIAETADDIAEYAGITRTKFLSNIIEINVKSYNNAKKLGYIHFFLLIRSLLEKVKQPDIKKEDIDHQKNIEELQGIIDDLIHFRSLKNLNEAEKNENLEAIIEKIKKYVIFEE
jgi:hypothetical protein